VIRDQLRPIVQKRSQQRHDETKDRRAVLLRIICAVARGVSFSTRVEKREDLACALTEALARDAPALVEVLVDRQELSMSPAINLEQAWGFSHYMILGRTKRKGRRTDRSG
jgi:thiamine pyrophosphate-dependent acetolactate synthase large subunit-like protein